MEKITQPLFPVYSSDNTSQHSVAAVNIFLQSCYKIIGEWFHHLFSFLPVIINNSHFSLGNTFKNTDTKSFFCFAAKLCGSQDSSVQRHFYMFTSCGGRVTMG